MNATLNEEKWVSKLKHNHEWNREENWLIRTLRHTHTHTHMHTFTLKLKHIHSHTHTQRSTHSHTFESIL
jgi:hypothetical protein